MTDSMAFKVEFCLALCRKPLLLWFKQLFKFIRVFCLCTVHCAGFDVQCGKSCRMAHCSTNSSFNLKRIPSTASSKAGH